MNFFVFIALFCATVVAATPTTTIHLTGEDLLDYHEHNDAATAAMDLDKIENSLFMKQECKLDPDVSVSNIPYRENVVLARVPRNEYIQGKTIIEGLLSSLDTIFEGLDMGMLWMAKDVASLKDALGNIDSIISSSIEKGYIVCRDPQHWGGWLYDQFF